MYPVVNDIAAFCKRKRNTQMVILGPAVLPRKCDHCGEPITDHHNRADIQPRTQTVKAYHYACSWAVTLSDVYSAHYGYRIPVTPIDI